MWNCILKELSEEFLRVCACYKVILAYAAILLNTQDFFLIILLYFMLCKKEEKIGEMSFLSLEEGLSCISAGGSLFNRQNPTAIKQVEHQV